MRRTQDNRLFVAALAKGAHGEHWRRLFRGDPDYARCLLPPYRLAGMLHVSVQRPYND